jgi:hypothetical protein
MSRVIVLPCLVFVALLVVSCGGSGDRAGSGESSGPVLAVDGEPIVLMFTSDGFDPEAIQIGRGAALLIRNETDGTVSFVVDGTAENGGPLEVEGGGLRRLVLADLGAQIITVEGANGDAATVMVVERSTP